MLAEQSIHILNLQRGRNLDVRNGLRGGLEGMERSMGSKGREKGSGWRRKGEGHQRD